MTSQPNPRRPDLEAHALEQAWRADVPKPANGERLSTWRDGDGVGTYTRTFTTYRAVHEINSSCDFDVAVTGTQYEDGHIDYAITCGELPAALTDEQAETVAEALIEAARHLRSDSKHD